MFATSVFPSGSGTSVVTSIIGAFTANIAQVLVVLGFMLGLTIVFALLTSSFGGGLSLSGAKADNDWDKDAHPDWGDV